MRPRLILALAAAALAAACATTTPYQPADKRGLGYKNQQLETAKYRVTFQGNSLVDRATAENYVLLRAAQVTLENGFDSFEIVSQNADGLSTYRTSGTSLGFGGLGGGGLFYGGGFGYGGFGGLASNTSTTRESRSYVVGAVIEARKGPKPADNPMAFDARSVIESIGPTIAGPPAGQP